MTQVAILKSQIAHFGCLAVVVDVRGEARDDLEARIACGQRKNAYTQHNTHIK